MAERNKPTRQPDSFNEIVFPQSRVTFEPRSFDYKATYVDADTRPETIAAMLGVYNSGDLDGFQLLAQLVSPLGISRDLRLRYPKNGKNYSFGGIGVTTVDRQEEVVVGNPQRNLSISKYVQLTKGRSASSMKILIIGQDGTESIIQDDTPIGAYTPEGAEEKRVNMQRADSLLAGVALVPKVELTCTDSNLGLAGFVTSAPSRMNPGYHISKIAANRLLGNKITERNARDTLMRSLAGLSHALCILHMQGFVHNQPGGNWGTVIDKGNISIVLRDWETMQDIRNHKTTPIQGPGIKRSISPQELARMNDLNHVVRSLGRMIDINFAEIPTNEKGLTELRRLSFELKSQLPWLVLRAYSPEKLKDIKAVLNQPNVYLTEAANFILLEGLLLKIRGLPVTVS